MSAPGRGLRTGQVVEVGRSIGVVERDDLSGIRVAIHVGHGSSSTKVEWIQRDGRDVLEPVFGW